MIESIIVLSIAGFITGVVFSVPAAGPVTILVVSNALKGKQRFCHRVAYGAAVADFVYTFIAVYAFSHLYHLYQPYTPYIGAAASIFLVLIGIRMLKTKIDYEHMDDSSLLKDKLRNRGGFRIGMMVNLLNPALFAGWLISSFLVITLLASLGYNTGGLSDQINQTIKDINDRNLTKRIEKQQKILDNIIENMSAGNKDISSISERRNTTTERIMSSLIYAVMVTFGSTLWFYLLGNFIIIKRQLIRLSTINKVVYILGILLLLSAVYLAYSSFKTLVL